MTTSLTAVIKKLLVLFLVISGLYFAKNFLMPLCIGGILATLFLPFCNWLEKKKIPRSIAVCLCLFSLLIVVFILFSVLGYKISELINDIASLKQKALEIGTELQKYIFNQLHISIDQQFEILKKEQPSYSSIVQMMIGSLTSFLSTIILLLVYFVFLLYYRNHLKKFMVQLTAESQQGEILDIIKKVTAVSQQYLLGLSKMIFLLWVMYGIGFGIIGVENAIFFAVLCGMLEIVPFIGNITGTTLTVLVSAMHGASVEIIIGILIVYGIVQFIQGWVLEPLILGPQVKINSLFTIIALVLGQLLWGIPGIILAIPITAMLKIVCDHIIPLQPYGFLIGEVEKSTNKNDFIEKIKAKFYKLK